MALIIIIDQWIKLEVKTSMTLFEKHKITSWFYIYFIENNGMAFGMSFINKTILSLFRLVAIIAIAVVMYKLIKKGARWIAVVLLAMLWAGATGNLIDCIFYGMCFTQSSPDYVSYCVPFGQGYSTLLNGKVVDMFYFPLIVTEYPSWVPIYGGQQFIFFSPIFNFADAAVSCSVIAAFIFCKKELAELMTVTEDADKSESHEEVKKIQPSEKNDPSENGSEDDAVTERSNREKQL